MQISRGSESKRAPDCEVFRAVQLSEELYRSFDIDGLLYASRLTGAECVAVYDRAVKTKLASRSAAELVRHADLASALRSIGVTVRRGR